MLIRMAVGKASADAKEFELIATHESESFGIRSAPFLEYAFKRESPDIELVGNGTRASRSSR
jgi:hypothetical protein